MYFWWLKKRFHVSWCIALLSLGVVIGVVTVRFIGPIANTLWLMAAVLLGGIALWRAQVWVVPLVLASGLLLGIWRGSLGLVELVPYKRLVGSIVTLRGSVTEDPVVVKGGQLTLQLHVVQANKMTLGGVVWVSAGTKYKIKRGDEVALQGKLQSGFGNIAASMYRANVLQVQRPQPGDVAGRVRDWFSGGIKQAIPGSEASLGIGYLVGQRTALPSEFDDALQLVGLTHVVVASGYNLTILVRLARRLFARISKYLATFFGGSLIVGFMAITGLSPSMSRAGLVAGLSLLAWYYGRKIHPLVLLPFSAAVTLLINPSYGWGDLGWQLSFAAFAGVMIVAPLLQRYLFGKKEPGVVRQILGETIAAELMTLPIIVLAFGQFSNVSLLANLLVLPFVPLAMLLTFIAGIGGLTFSTLATIIGAPASWLLQYMMQIVTMFAALPGVQTTLKINVGVVTGYYVVLIALCWYMWRKTKYNLLDANLVE